MQMLKMTVFGSLAVMLLTGCAAIASLKGVQQGHVDTSVRLYEQSDAALPADSVQTAVIPHTDLKLTITPFPTLTEQDVQSAELYNTSGGKAVFLRFDPHGEIVLDEMTTRLRDRYIVVMINNHPVSAWRVDQRIINGQFLIEGEFTDEEAQKIVDDLNKLSKMNKQ